MKKIGLKKVFVVLFTLVLIIILIVPTIYYVSLWRVERGIGDNLIMNTTDLLEVIGPLITPLLVWTYQDEKAHHNRRLVAALVLGQTNKEKAEEVFLKHLRAQDDQLVIEAIHNLWILGSIKTYKEILTHLSSSNYEVRMAVAEYLRAVPSQESIEILKGIASNDPSEATSKMARASLLEIGITYHERGINYMKRGEHDKAVDFLNKSIALDPIDSKAYIDRSLIYAIQGDSRRAFIDLNTSIELDHRNYEAYLYRGIAYEKEGNHNKALEDLNKAIELNPISAEAYSKRAIVYEKLGSYEKAIQDIKRAAKAGDKNAQGFLKSKGINWET